MTRLLFPSILCAMCVLSSLGNVCAQQIEIPRRHDRPPNAPMSAEESATKMTVPEGFSVEVVAAEPDIMNPVAMFIDERGRFWITESFEYPRHDAGPGRDRIKILEDTDGDGRVDKVTVFAEGLNIPSGIAVGYGGVWVINSPDLLFMQDTDGDGKADKSEVVVTGFGRTDTHELPNSLTWGPDGWLYGLNGVFNYSSVTYGPTNPNFKPDQKPIDFTCAMFRIHPRTREFQIFAEGTSNPWGIAINDEGEFFISACVIDHLWHIVETGYYIRQGGPYPPHTWPIGSIVKHKHQKAAYCGITWFDSDAYPPEYRGVLYMGNIHGGCINADIAEREGSTYKGKPHPGFTAKPQAWKDDQYGTIAKTGDPNDPKLADFLTANDAWFMPVVQKTGPDGCLYILDWYDRYHCYQDANADPAGIDRAKGRLYRVRYKETPHAKPFDLNKKNDDELIDLLGNPNVYYRDAAQRLLGERNNPETASKLNQLIASEVGKLEFPTPGVTPRVMHIIWTRMSLTSTSLQWIVPLLKFKIPVLQAWGLRILRRESVLLQELAKVEENEEEYGELLKLLMSLYQSPRQSGNLHRDIDPQVVLQQMLWMNQSTEDNRLVAYLSFPELCSLDDHLRRLLWQNTKGLILEVPNYFSDLETGHILISDNNSFLLERTLNLLCTSGPKYFAGAANLLNIILCSDAPQAFKSQCLGGTIREIQSGAIPRDQLEVFRRRFDSSPQLKRIDLGEFGDFQLQELRALMGDFKAQSKLIDLLASTETDASIRLESLKTLVVLENPSVLKTASQIFASNQSAKDFRIAILDSISKLNDPQVATVLLTNFSTFEPDVQPKVIEVLTQRPAWSVALLQDIEAGKIDKSLVNLNQLIRMSSFKDEALQQLVTKNYGTVRMQRSNRQKMINQKKDFLYGTPGDPVAGVAVFKKVCAQCHKIYGEGAEVGPDITRNGRNNWDQLLQNVFDPSAVIGPGYQARMIATEDGRVLTGLPVEDSPERVVLKIQGGKLETIPRDQIEDDKLSELSLMPEDVEKLMTPQELADLFAFLSLDQPPEKPEAKILPGAPNQKRR